MNILTTLQGRAEDSEYQVNKGATGLSVDHEAQATSSPSVPYYRISAFYNLFSKSTQVRGPIAVA